ncbi:MAG: DUF3107 domain-containing protein [Propionibacteriaceae bacterium]|jgi:hypothetical protein|nr:DUF3107 domain-containing protein [Propionibacteriaceae bacterium]
MEIKIGIQNVARELGVDVDLTIEQVTDAYTQALVNKSHLLLTDTSGRQTLIPAAGIGYIEFGQEHTRRVGFGALA